VTLVLIVSASRFGNSRALPAVARSCDADAESCNHGALSDPFLGGPLINLLPRLDQTQDLDLSHFTTHWSRQEHPLFPRHEIRAVAPKIPDKPDPVNPTNPKPDSPGADPKNPNSSPKDPNENPSGGIDPTKSGSTPTAPENNPDAGLDPTKPKPSTEPEPSTEPSPSPSAASDPANSGSNRGPDDTTPANGAAGCSRKRAGEPCPGASDNGLSTGDDATGDDVHGEAPDTVASTRSNRPADDSNVPYDYLAEVVSERGTGLVNDKLANLRSRIATQAPDDPVRVDEINSKYTFDSKSPLAEADPDAKHEPVDLIFEFDDVFTSDLSHDPFKALLGKTDVTLTDSRGMRDALRSNDATSQTVKWSRSGDQKVAFADWSFLKNDNSDMSPKAHYTELTMALFKERGVVKTFKRLVESESSTTRQRRR
jgi:hypothetical protein